jgi:hypothetical protein
MILTGHIRKEKTRVLQSSQQEIDRLQTSSLLLHESMEDERCSRLNQDFNAIEGY